VASLLAGSQSEIRAASIARMATWQEHPAQYVRDVFGAEPDPWQERTLEAFPSNPRQAMVACKGPGKTTVETWLNWNFLSTRPYPSMAATAITGQNLRDNLWKELAAWRSRSPYLRNEFEIEAQRAYRRGLSGTWFLSARTWNRDASEEQQGDALSGLHSQFVMVTIDEAGGVPQSLLRAADGVMANLGTASCTEAHVLIGGNPTDLTGPLHRAAHEDRPDWWLIFITGDPDDPNRAPRVSREWAQRRIDKLGRDAYEVRVDVLGKFPLASAEALIVGDLIDASFVRWADRGSLAQGPRSLGVDVARFGVDRSVVCRRSGDLVYAFRPGDSWQGNDTEFTAGRAAKIADEFAGGHTDGLKLPIFVDDIGVGGGVTDKLKAMGYNVTGISVDAAPTYDPEKRHTNLKSQLCGDIQDRFRVGAIALDPSIGEATPLKAEATTLRVAYSAGKRRIEGKEDYKRRTGRSTDYFDAMMLAFAGGSMAPPRRSGAFELMRRQMAEREAAKKAKLAGVTVT